MNLVAKRLVEEAAYEYAANHSTDSIPANPDLQSAHVGNVTASLTTAVLNVISKDRAANAKK